LHHFLGAQVNEYTEEITRVFLLGAVTRVFKPGTKFDYLLCLYGGQGIGKSSFCRLLALKDEWFTDDMRDLEKEKVYQKLQGHWIVELSEMLATNNAKSIEVTKSFMGHS
jgi:predicted P-loop ATPase